MTVRDALREGAAALSGSGTPFLDASLLLAAALGMDATRLLASGPEAVAEASLARFREGLASRSGGLPVAYILGYKEFWGRRFRVDPRVLVPRPDTEALVEAALKLGDIIIRERTEPREADSIHPHRAERPLRVHECCTGSGCVAISLAAERPEWEASASDLSEGALAVAEANAEALLGAGREGPARPGGAVEFIRSDLLEFALPPTGIDGYARAGRNNRVSARAGRNNRASARGFDLILANPPYVPSSETEGLLGQGWSEPRMALDGGRDGLDILRRLVPQAASALDEGGALLVEADGGQSGAVAEMFRASRFADIRTSRDLGGEARVTSGRKTWRT
jgi:release factor glutamine methyltransferase